GPKPWIRRWAGWAFAGIVAVELLSIHGPANPAMPRRLYFPTLPPIAFLQSHLGADLGPHTGSDRFGAQGAGFFPNVPVVYGLADVRYTNPEKPYRVAVAMRPVLKALIEIDDQLRQGDHPL